MHHRLSKTLVVVSLLTIVLAGCGSDNPLNRQAVSGSVTLDAAPLDRGTIEFVPQQAGGVGSGTVIADGSYSIKADKGLPPGKYLVRLYSAEAAQPTGEPQPPGPSNVVPGKERIPPQYNVKSDQVVEVVAGADNRFDFNIPTK